ncbi:hypothetical protein [Ornithinicoccus halotolerans]|uniref:hypothetical protein n=1 Tax=Ornithinicoccus halotolerans TaxID=1748220 RepID=UPI00129617FF|nr:hypothetical protein [Ornithinicoccus halotolerans]
MSITECLRCGAPVLQSSRGRPARWCSQKCRRAAYEERRAAANGAVAVRVIRESEPAPQLSLVDHVTAVLASPAACRRVLRELTGLAGSGQLWDPRRSGVPEAAGQLARALAGRLRR